jgi:hypothetical protein
MQPSGNDIHSPKTIRGLSGNVSVVSARVPVPLNIKPLSALEVSPDIDLRRMAQWAMNYLIRTPNEQFNYEPVFQCHPLQCPPVPSQRDVVVPCDTDARMFWEWYYMRDICGSTEGKQVEAAFRQRMLGYIQADGTVLAHVGCYNEGDINKVYTDADRVYHVWGATKILHGLTENFRRTGSEKSKTVARQIMLRLQKLAVYPTPNQCYFPGGMGAVTADGTIIPNGWNQQPAPILEPLVNYYLATGDTQALEFAHAYAEGILAGLQPGGIRIEADGIVVGYFKNPDGTTFPHSHATMHAVWGMAHIGLVTGEVRFVDMAKKVWDWMLTRGTGTGWFPAGPANCNETCMISDMMSVAALIAQSGHAEYFDYVERYLRNYISNLQFIVTPEFEAYYQKINAAAGEEQIRRGLEDLRKFQGGILGGSGLNDYENELLGGVSGFEMFGCCAPEGMRAIYTSWLNTIDRFPESKLGPAGVYINLGLSRESPWGQVVSFFPDAGRVTVRASVKESFFLRPPHWASRQEVRAFVGTNAVPVVWSGDYVRFDDVIPGQELTIAYPLVTFTQDAGGEWETIYKGKLTFDWLGNMVVASDPPATKTPLFTGKPRQLPDWPGILI